jgi:beta-lactamase superfamily II metal-dependent hydrolase
MFRIILFDVQHGFCAFVKSPTGLTLLIDCGRGNGFSPVRYLAQHEILEPYMDGYPLTELLVSHPHEDHIDDISNVTSILRPFLLKRQRYVWDAVKQEAGGDYRSLDHYSGWQQTYSLPGPNLNWGFDFKTFSLTPEEAKRVGSSKYVNNSGIVTILTFQGTQTRRKIIFGADVEQSGWQLLLSKRGFIDAVKDPDFYVAAHHGHSSGFSTDLFRAMGKCPYLNLISVTDCDEHVDSRYSSSDFSRGANLEEGIRYMLSTRTDGSIFIDINHIGGCSVARKDLRPNLARYAVAGY